MRPTNLAIGVILILLLAAMPVNASPSLEKGKQADYKLSASVSLLQSCGIIGVSSSSNTVVCPMIVTIPSTVNINGTLGWTAADLSSTNASLNVTRDLTISNADSTMSIAHSAGSFTESINLATRIVNIMPVLMPELDQALQMAQTSIASSLPTGVSFSSSMPILDVAMMRQPVYTMWWVNGPLKQDQTIPVLVVPTNVTGTTSIDLGGSIGPRTGWVLAFSLPQILPVPDPLATSSSTPISESSEIAFTFIYDQTSDLLLSANADIHLGFGVETSIPLSPCDPSTALTTCPMPTASTVIMREFGVDIQASLTLASTNLDLTQMMTPTVSPQASDGGSQSGAGSSSGAGSGTGSGSNSGTDTGSGSSSGTSGTTSGTRKPSSNAGQPRSPDSLTTWLHWIYVLSGIVAAAIVGTSVWVARRRVKRTTTKSRAILPAV
jgi:hypothetical protein